MCLDIKKRCLESDTIDQTTVYYNTPKVNLTVQTPDAGTEKKPPYFYRSTPDIDYSRKGEDYFSLNAAKKKFLAVIFWRKSDEANIIQVSNNTKNKSYHAGPRMHRALSLEHR